MSVFSEYLPQYVQLLQVAAVTGVACVLITNAASDMFATEATGTAEIGTGKAVQAQKYRGFWANTCRLIVFTISGLLALLYTGLVIAIVSSTLTLAASASCRDIAPSKRVNSALGKVAQLDPPAPGTRYVTNGVQDAVSTTKNVPASKDDCFIHKVRQYLPLTDIELQEGVFRPVNLRISFIVVVSITILAACWIAFLAIILRWKYMRRPGASAFYVPR